MEQTLQKSHQTKGRKPNKREEKAALPSDTLRDELKVNASSIKIITTII